MSQIAQALVTAGLALNTREQVAGRDMTKLEITQTNITADKLINEPLALLPNPVTVIDRLQKMNKDQGNRALTNLCSTMAFYVVNALMWQHRKSNKKSTTTSDIDPFAGTNIDDFNNAAAEEELAAASADAIHQTAAHDQLPRVDGIKYVGVYKYLFLSLRARNLDASKYRMPDPTSTFNQMQTPVDAEAINATYDSMAWEHIKSDALKRRAHEAHVARGNAMIERNGLKLKAELDYVNSEIQSTHPEPFTDAVWETLPLYVQYRTIVAVQKVTIDAFLAEVKKPTAERIHEFSLSELMDELQDELVSVVNKPEIKQAFEEGKLDAIKHTIQ